MPVNRNARDLATLREWETGHSPVAYGTEYTQLSGLHSPDECHFAPSLAPLDPRVPEHKKAKATNRK
ncbi:MAG: hypothetical protein A2070_00615 [Bdellovibrionales bacterium GWC1_52_8]|nr:MAG: hypothetical protein A2X97_11550 [Bdellovibrionales bacterium GWA1_52_35]OFZ42196.1 MAG: hypothetical protein A2070_00615 [Bdellovibrionales bacterium GWC1_52_8]